MRRAALAIGVLAAVLLPPAAGPAPAATPKTVHAKVRLPGAGHQSFGLYSVKVQAAKGAPAPKIRVRLANLDRMPAGIRAAAARTKPVRAGGAWTFELLVAINNLGSEPAVQRGGQAPGAADIVIEVFSGKPFPPDREFVDDCLTRAEQRAWAKAAGRIAVYYALGRWPSSPREIFQHVSRSERAGCP